MTASEVLLAITARAFAFAMPCAPPPEAAYAVRRLSTGEIISFEDLSYDPAWTTYTDSYEWVC